MITDNHHWVAIVIVLLMFSIPNHMQANSSDQKIVVGWLEKVYLPAYDFALRGKMDTGAKNSSVHATDMEFVKAEGTPPRSRIRFKLEDTKGRFRVIEADVLREVRVKRSTLASGVPVTETRVEIDLEVCLAGRTKRIKINLTNRQGMNYRMILGRSALEGDFVVDVGKKFISGSVCRDKSKK